MGTAEYSWEKSLKDEQEATGRKPKQRQREAHLCRYGVKQHLQGRAGLSSSRTRKKAPVSSEKEMLLTIVSYFFTALYSLTKHILISYLISGFNHVLDKASESQEANWFGHSLTGR